MIRAFLIVIVLLAFGPAEAQMMPLTGTGGSGVTAAAPPPGYAGPGDIVSGATAWYGLRCYSAAQASLVKAITIRRASDNATQDIGLTSNCDLDTATATTFCTATTCFATEVYDQTGNGNHVLQATAANQPQLLLTGCSSGSLPCLSFVGVNSQSLQTGSGSVTASQPITHASVYSAPNQSQFSGILTPTADGPQSGAGNSTGAAYCYAGNLESAFFIADSVWHSVQTIFNGPSSIINADNTQTPADCGTDGYSSSTLILGASSAEFFTGLWAESGSWPSGFSTGNQTSVCHNQFLYWGTSVSC